MGGVQPYGQYNPKKDTFRPSASGGLFGFDMLEDPLPFEVSDVDDIKEFFLKKKLVPYNGTTHSSGHGLLVFYDWMAKASVTSGACINAKKLTAFGGPIKVGYNYDPVFDLGEEEKKPPPYAEQKKFAEMCGQVIFGKSDKNLKRLSANIYEEYESNGNGWLELKLFEVAGEKFVAMHSHRQKEVLFEYTEYQDGYVKVSKSWDENYLRKRQPDVIPLYPNFETAPDGSLRTMLHISNGTNRWYGRPPSQSSSLHQYSEYQNKYYQVKQAGKEFTGKLLVEVEDDQPKVNRLIDNVRDRKAGFKNTQDRFEKNFTRKASDPSTFLLFSRPFGSKPMSVFQIAPNTSHKYFETTDKLDEKKIVMSHSWAINLLGVGGATGLSTNIYLDELSIKDATTNLHNQEEVKSIVGAALSEANIWLNAGVDDLGIIYSSPFAKIIKMKKEDGNSNAN